MTIPYEDLIAYAAGELAPGPAARVEAELAADPVARRSVERYRSARRAMARDDSVAPPADAVARAKSIFDPAALLRPSRWWETLDRVIAAVTFDSRLQPAAVRYADATGRIQLAVEADHVDVDLQAERTEDGGWRIVGQVAGDRIASCPVVLLDAEGASALAETATDERGLFAMSVGEGRYSLGIGIAEQLVFLPSLELPAD